MLLYDYFEDCAGLLYLHTLGLFCEKRAIHNTSVYSVTFFTVANSILDTIHNPLNSLPVIRLSTNKLCKGHFQEIVNLYLQLASLARLTRKLFLPCYSIECQLFTDALRQPFVVVKALQGSLFRLSQKSSARRKERRSSRLTIIVKGSPKSRVARLNNHHQQHLRERCIN